MEILDELIQSEPNELISALDKYQADIIKAFLNDAPADYLGCIDKWLTASAFNTERFGGNSQRGVYKEKIIEEIEKFLCGDKAYDKERKEVNANKSKEFAISGMSAAIGHYLGIAGTFLAPVVVLFLINCGKIGVNAWCELQKTNKQKNE